MLYKVTNENGAPCNGGTGRWFLPSGKRPGKWMPIIRRVVPCERGYHLCTKSKLVLWLGPRIWEAEGRGDCVWAADKLVFAQARLLRRVPGWDERAARFFACDCAEHVMPIWAAAFPNDTRPQEALAATRRFLNGKISESRLRAIEKATECAVVDSRAVVPGYSPEATALRSAMAAVYAAIPPMSAAMAGYSATTAWAAVRAAGTTEEEIAELAWQTKRLGKYLRGEVR